ncbi:zinc-dependent metalloprotease [Chitinophaga nivalis]|uniref:Zinc-dependent metalloprotease n=1 Tax=Chitinophaga nivalis TaxID=2991709 RepID=A0ABT3IRA8_9BACT|nr:zinc-dependent metalloprotease [Chitinophaga nivalis]MCW3463793.1 zinc-dependent metalloprotease [Chitinophaga nivalis]MCW3486517.1 zinc-dependent metalloprotease [Chitinophaga nivalis]
MATSYRKLLWLLPCVALSAQCIVINDAAAQSKKKSWGLFGKKKTAVVADTTAKKKPDMKGLKPYKEVITADAVSKNGLFKVHRVKTDFYFEIPLKLLGRQLLVVNKLSKVPEQLNDAGVNKGMNYENIVISFERDTTLNKVFIRKQNPFLEVPAGNAIAQSVADNFTPSVIDYFKIEAYSTDTSALVINVSKVFDGSNSSINNVFDALGMGSSPSKDLSRILAIKTFEDNIVAKSELTAKVTGVQVSVETTTNLVLLSDNPMTARFADRRVGLFTTPRWYFSDDQHKLEERQLVTRWRLEPKPEDKQRYLKGELVEPAKPIVYYIDASTPAKWRPYIKAGIEDWQKAFEAAGFKNAIVAKEVPTNDPDFDPDDVRYSVVTYAASAKANAMGPSVIDPRSGEILEADIIWWHNVMSTLHSWVRIQTGAIDPRARGNHFSDSLMGHAIRFVSSHEVGHTLGLQHNMGSSFAFEVDSLRSPEFTARMGGTAPSIMDYARFNYVAQPEDQVKQITPAIGVYDKFAIGWAYRYTGSKTPHEELPSLNQQLRQHENDPMYAFGEQQDVRDAIDPRSQIEDLGNNAVKASRYGLLNLKRIVPQIISWTKEEGESYDEAGKMLNSAIGQWNQYAYHVLANVGGIYITPTVYGQQQPTYLHVEKKKQQEAVKYLVDEVFNTPAWLFRNEVYRKSYPIKESPIGNIEYGSLVYAKSLQSYLYYDLLRDERLSRMLENEAANGRTAYTVTDLMSDMHQGVFAKTIRGQALDIYERNSQKGFVDALIISIDKSVVRAETKKLQEEKPLTTIDNFCTFSLQPHLQEDRASRNMMYFAVNRVSDAVSAKRGELSRLLQLLQTKKNIGDRATADHYNDLIFRINQALNTK